MTSARKLVVERGLTGSAIGALTETVKGLPLDALAPVKQLLKRFFSDQPWTNSDDGELAAIVGPGSGSHRLALDRELTLVWGWDDGTFFLRVTNDEMSFESEVIPEVTPSPRTIRFTTPPLHAGASLFYNSMSEAAADARVAHVFSEFDAVTNVLVGPNFVAVTISRPDQWEILLGPILGVVAEEFTGIAPDSGIPARSEPTSPSVEEDADHLRSPRRLELAWSELGSLRGDRPEDLERILAETQHTEPAHRQVAVALLADAPPDVAAPAWDHLFEDDSRTVRRSVIDAVVDAHREPLRPLLERALADPDAWIRWKAVRGIATLGSAPSRAAIEARTSDPDFRVRLEATRTLR